MVMEDNTLSKVIFCERARAFFRDMEDGEENVHNSTVFDLLSTCSISGLIDEVRNMVENQHYYHKQVWKRKVWTKGWELENTYWLIEKRMHRSLDLLSNIGNESRYSVWWHISDKYTELTSKCEIMMKILCHASILKADDVKSRNQPRVNRMCGLCDRFEVEDARHFLLQCTYFHQERVKMLNDISNIDICIDDALPDTDKDI